MIGGFGEGVAQALLPCSWTLLVPAFLLGLATRRPIVLGTYAGATVLTIWFAVAGWLVPPFWVAGTAFLVGGILWWRLGATVAPATIVALGAAWAWQPCVGPELGAALTAAQRDPVAALGGLAAFVVGVLAVGFVAGLAVRRWSADRLDRVGAIVVALLGLTMVIGIYPRIASTFARWSTSLWA
jgi:cytochrome c biogenesis protein CcdA